MAVATKTINGQVLNTAATGLAGGRLHIRLSKIATVDDSGTQQVVVPPQDQVIAPDGDVQFDLIPNDAMTPGDTFYIFTYYPPKGAIAKEYVRVLSADSDPIAIGDLTRVAAAAGSESLSCTFPVYTEATKPAANAANAYKPYFVRDTASNAYGEVILQNAAGGYEYAIWIAI